MEENKNLSSLSKKELIEMIKDYKEKISAIEEFNQIMRADSMR